MTPVIETKNLTKVYEGAVRGQDVRALTKLNLAINPGEIFGFLGPNGSGKTTTIKMLLGLIFPTSGSIKIMGSSSIGSPGIRRQIGYLPEGAYYPDFLRGEEVLKFYGELYGLHGADLRRRIDQTIELVGMTRARKRLIRGYSKGMRQRIGLAQALLSDPQILILDEPTTGLDPIARLEIRDILVNLRDQGKTLFISSHELLEVELISNRVGILFEGVMQTFGALSEVLAERDTALEILKAPQQAIEKFTAAGLKVEDHIDDKTVLRASNNTVLYAALDICKAEKLTLVGVRPRRETLEELFVRVIGAAEQKARQGGSAA